VSQTGDLGQRLVDALHTVHGEHAGFRAAHAKGSCCVGTFSATPEAAKLTRAAHMQGAPIAVTVRFSNGSGIPTYPDYARSDGRGMAVGFHLPNGERPDMVALTLPVFFVRTPEDFIEFLAATRPDPGTGQPDLARIGAFLERHPETQRGMEVALGGVLPSSYLRAVYNGIHAFRLVDSAGSGRWIRYRWDPEVGAEETSSQAARQQGRDYLQDDLRRRLESGPEAFRLIFILAQDGDPLTDPTAAWPADRQEVVAGRLELSRMLSDAEPDCPAEIFDPTNVVDGIECSDDPVLHARSRAYAVSFALRRGLTAPRPAAAPAELSGFAAVAGAGEIIPGEIRGIELDGARIAVASVDGQLHAFGDICTHRQCALSDGTLEGTIITCPCHGSQFDVTSGAVLRGPATEPVATYAVRVSGDSIEVGEAG
jgi:catalase